MTVFFFFILFVPARVASSRHIVQCADVLRNQVKVMSKVDAMIYKEWHVKRFSMMIDDAQLGDGADDVLPEKRKQDNTKKL